MSDRVSFSLFVAAFGIVIAAVGVVGIFRSKRVGPLTWVTTQAHIARILLGALTCASVVLVTIRRAHWWWWVSLAVLFMTVMAYHYIRYGTEEKPETLSGVISSAGLGIAAAAPVGCAAEVILALVVTVIIALGLAVFQLFFG